jgi:hypothetical protein
MSASVTRRRAERFRARAAGASHRMPWLVDVYRAARNPRWEADLWRDLRSTRRSAEFLRRLPAAAPDAPVALVGLYRDDVFDAKVGLTLATALRLRGMRPVVSVPSGRQRRVARYAAAYGVADVVVQEDVELAAADLRERDDVVGALLDGELDFATIATWRFREWAIGTHVLSTVIRLTFDGSPDLTGANRELLATVLGDVITNHLRSEKILHDHAPKVVLVEEANYSVNGPLVDVATARGVDAIQTIGTWRDDALMSKRLTAATRRVDAKSVASSTLDELLAQPWTPDDDAELDHDFDRRYGGTWRLGRQFQPGTEPRTGEQIVAELGLDPARPTAVVFAHVLWDASLFYGVDLFENYSDWLVRSVGAAIENDRVNWIVKAHPSNVFRSAHGDVEGECSEIVLLRDAFPSLPAHVKVLRPETKISTVSLYRFASFGVTVRGTPGMEMACFGKPVFTAGTGTYAGLGFTYDSDSPAQFLGRLAEIETYGPLPADMTTRARRYADALFLRRPWVPRSFSLSFAFAERGWSPLDRNVAWRAGSVEELRRAGDLDAWAEWVLDSREPDYVESRSRLAGATPRP